MGGAKSSSRYSTDDMGNCKTPAFSTTQSFRYEQTPRLLCKVLHWGNWFEAEKMKSECCAAG